MLNQHLAHAHTESYPATNTAYVRPIGSPATGLPQREATGLPPWPRTMQICAHLLDSSAIQKQLLRQCCLPGIGMRNNGEVSPPLDLRQRCGPLPSLARWFSLNWREFGHLLGIQEEADMYSRRTTTRSLKCWHSCCARLEHSQRYPTHVFYGNRLFTICA